MDSTENTGVPTDVSATVNWQAQEYVDVDRGPAWYIVFLAVVLVFIAVDVFLIKSWTFSALVIVMAVSLFVYTRRPPRTITYSLSIKQGLYIGEKLYSFSDFRAFGLLNDDGSHSIMLLPRKRFSPGVSVYFPEDVGEQLVDIIGQQLPMEDVKLDPIDVVVRKLRL